MGIFGIILKKDHLKKI